MISIAGRRPVPAKAILRFLFADEGGVSTLPSQYYFLEGGPSLFSFPSLLTSLSLFRINFSRRVDNLT